MKIVLFTSGLGNQIFQYLFSLYLKEKFPEQKIYGYYKKKFLNKHNGLEVNNIFEVEMPIQTGFSKIIADIVRYLNMLGIRNFKSIEKPFNDKAVYFDGWWQNKQFFLDNIQKVKFRNIKLSERNKLAYKLIKADNSVSLHVRRGDYCDIERKSEFGNACTQEYYQKAIKKAKQSISDPQFFVFSDDIVWVRQHMNIPNAHYIDWNHGTNSYLDMYLMSNCKASIIANSSFSYWGAMLGREKQIVIRPTKWIGNQVPDIFPKKWINL